MRRLRKRNGEYRKRNAPIRLHRNLRENKTDRVSEGGEPDYPLTYIIDRQSTAPLNVACRLSFTAHG
jgi:hypothetical protein